MEDDNVGEIGAGSFEHARRRAVGVDFAIAFVGEDEETEPSRQRGELFQISSIISSGSGVPGAELTGMFIFASGSGAPQLWQPPSALVFCWWQYSHLIIGKLHS